MREGRLVLLVGVGHVLLGGLGNAKDLAAHEGVGRLEVAALGHVHDQDQVGLPAQHLADLLRDVARNVDAARLHELLRRGIGRLAHEGAGSGGHHAKMRQARGQDPFGHRASADVADADCQDRFHLWRLQTSSPALMTWAAGRIRLARRFQVTSGTESM